MPIYPGILGARRGPVRKSQKIEGTERTEPAHNVSPERATGLTIHEQDLLLPPSPRQWLDDDRVDIFVSDVVDQLDLSAIHCFVRAGRRAQPRARSLSR